MTNTDEAYRRYCQEYGPCNRVVFDAAYRMGRTDAEMKTDSQSDPCDILSRLNDGLNYNNDYYQTVDENHACQLVEDAASEIASLRRNRADLLELIRNITPYAERYAESVKNEQYRQGVLSWAERAKEVTRENGQ